MDSTIKNVVKSTGGGKSRLEEEKGLHGIVAHGRLAWEGRAVDSGKEVMGFQKRRLEICA